MMSIEQLLHISEATLKSALKEKIDQAQTSAFLFDSARTRFANSQIHQNVASKKGGVTVKVAIGKRIGYIQAAVLESKQIERVVKQAVKIARVSPENKDFKSFPQPKQWQPLDDAFDAATATCSPDYRSERAKEAIDVAHSASPVVKAVAGSILSAAYSFAVTNSWGVSAQARMTLASMNITVISEKSGSEGFGHAVQSSRHITDINPVELGTMASEKSVNSTTPIKLTPKEYEVVLAPLAVSTLFDYLSYIGFSALPYQQGVSFVKYHLNEQVFDEKLSAKDDVEDPRTVFKLAVDGDGVPKKRLPLINEGSVSEASIFHNTLTASRENRESTGHALPPGLFRMTRPIPYPLNVLISPGTASIEEMIEETQNGIFVTRFHYTNPVEPTKAVLTGLTRDGTFKIANGEIAEPVKNLRYTDSMLSALKSIPLIGKELKAEQLGTVTVPAMKLEKLRFTGTTEY
ncbi:MAG: TldD/PmbA family protein [Candidatus Bathyarchaeota archaeon]|nr:MAG: TldD/PmbA family protein [Candidatus Bathyarchaeota archaeon]